jgi:hypothetical protein
MEISDSISTIYYVENPTSTYSCKKSVSSRENDGFWDRPPGMAEANCSDSCHPKFK